MPTVPISTLLGTDTLIQASYFLTAVLFIVGLKRMSSPVTARSGILWAGAGMLVATLVTFAYPGMSNYPLIGAAIVLGAALAWWSGKRVAMTNMPQMIALYNGMGGGAAAAIAAVELYRGGAGGYGERDARGDRRPHRRGVLQRQRDRLRQAPGTHQAQPALPRPAGAQHPAAGRRPAARRAARRTFQRLAARGHRTLRLRPDPRRQHDAADRRRRHAGGDLTLQRAHRASRSASTASCCTTRR